MVILAVGELFFHIIGDGADWEISSVFLRLTDEFAWLTGE
jgi:hypothetical protein